MVQRQIPQDLVSCRGKRQEHLTPILAAAAPSDVAGASQPIDQFDRAVMLDLQPLRQFADARARSVRKPFQREQQLVLARFEAGVTGRLLAERQESADLIPKLCQRFVIFRGKVRLHGRDYIGARCKSLLYIV